MKNQKKIIKYVTFTILTFYIIRLMFLLCLRLLLNNSYTVNPEKVMVNEAVWIARYWQIGASRADFQKILLKIEKQHQCKIDPRLWVLAEEDPIFSSSKEVVIYNKKSVNGSYLVVCKDLTIKWLGLDVVDPEGAKIKRGR